MKWAEYQSQLYNWAGACVGDTIAVSLHPITQSRVSRSYHVSALPVNSNDCVVRDG